MPGLQGEEKMKTIFNDVNGDAETAMKVADVCFECPMFAPISGKCAHDNHKLDAVTARIIDLYDDCEIKTAYLLKHSEKYGVDQAANLRMLASRCEKKGHCHD